ncbi:MAG: peptidoglycan DD-metalloendopeptidase family protein [Salinivirgaceae bacterium]|jgi:murein DD-endopeptidase MepM/ murein hydrolase activator NlpD|nr:peptidoglycan DD-metalloendopeptidase family protein [Salinivirgaceae bacterium]
MRKDLLLSLILTFSTLALLITCSKINDQPIHNEGAIHEIIEEEIIQLEYGLVIDSFKIESGVVKRYKNLSHILIPHGVTPKTIDKIAHITEPFDVRKIRSGNNYKLFFSKDSLKKLQYFVYEHTLTEYVLIKLVDSIEICFDEKPTSIKKKMASGTIKSNLWDAMIDNHINPMMSIELSEIYAWSIDFFDLKKGDQFYVIYEERYLDTLSAGIERIHAALFNHQNKDFYAIYFVQDEQGSYFDDKGGSLKREFLKAPLKYSRISSHFSKSRMHPVLKIRRPHSGIDYAALAGTPVYSVGDGFVLKKGYHKKGAGNFIKIKHNSVYTTQYAHLKGFANGLKAGNHVEQGQLIGYVGATGHATGPHLDFRFFKNGKAVDPLKVDAPPVEPIKKINKEEFEKIKNEFMLIFNDQKKH